MADDEIAVSRGFLRRAVLVLASLLLLVAVGALAVLATLRWPEPADRPVDISAGTRSHQTLYVALSGQRFEDIRLDNLDLGTPGIARALLVTTTAPIFVEDMVIDGLVCRTVTFTDVRASVLVVQDNSADGNSFSYVLTSTPAMVVGSLRGARSVSSTASTYDWAMLDGGLNGGEVKTLVISDVRARNAPCVFYGLRVGTLTVKNSTVGNGDGLDIADLIFESTVRVGDLTETGNIERDIAVK